MSTHLDPIARLCASCERGALFRDDQDFLQEGVDRNCKPILVQSEENAVRVTGLVLLRNDTLPDLPSLADSAQKGCDFCRFVRDIISAEDTQDEVRRLFGSSFTDSNDPCDVSLAIHFRWKYEIERDSRGDGLLGAIIALRFGDETEITLLCVAEGSTGAEGSDTWLGLGPPSDQSYGERHRIEWMSRMLNEDQYNRGWGEAFIPERLIRIDPSPRLVLRTDPNEYGSGRTTYAALSYCWGSREDAKQQLTTTTGSMAERRKGIVDKEMTSVLRDAIAVTRALNIPYLWVDSLCILQDDISDWERQCVDIAALYAHASVTLCAASSITCREGFLRQRGPRIRMPFRSIRQPGLVGSYFLQFKWAGVSPGHILSEETADSIHSRWGNRGWVFQENLSSSRKLVFGNANLHYHSPSFVKSMGRSDEKSTDSLALSLLGSKSEEEIYKSWASVVREYARFEDNSFTSIKDILPALSGLASYYCKWLQTDFYAGLWKGDLFRGLMWSCDGDSESLPSRECCLPTSAMRHNSISLPSWSPLGRGMFVNHAIYKDNHCFTSFQPEYTFLQANTTPAGDNPFGDIIPDWWLRIHSYVLNMATLDEKKLDIDDIHDELDGSRGMLIYEGKHIGHFEMDFSYRELGDDSTPGSPASMQEEISRFSWVLLGSCKVRNSHDPLDKARRARGACGLVVFSPPNSNEFFRVGVFYPAFPEHHNDGLFLFKKRGQLKSITIT